jgi:hypothetical protein
MSFDLFYQPCHFGTEPVERKDASAGEVQTDLPVKPLSADDLKSVQRVLARDAQGPDELGDFIVEAGDGGAAEIFCTDLSTGVMVSVRSLTPHVLRFLFDLLKAADWVLLPAMEDSAAIVSSPGLASGFADNFPEVVCESPEDLGKILSGGYDAWTGYRDQILDENG